jgi:hypothetical protein
VAGQANLTFDNKAQFEPAAQTTIVNDLCGFRMPHSLQALREFWFSMGPVRLAQYFVGDPAQQLATCGPGSIATLDPHKIDGATSTLY